MPSLQHPSRQDIEIAIKALEIQDEQEKMQLRLFWDGYHGQRRERTGFRVPIKKIAWFFLKMLIAAIAVGVFVCYWFRLPL